LSTHKKEKIPDSGSNDCNLWKTFNFNSCAATSTVGLEGMTFNLDVTGATTAGTAGETEHQQMINLLTDIWHNQATIIKWLSKIAENTKHSGKCTLED